MTHPFVDTVDLVPVCSLCGKEVVRIDPTRKDIPLEEDMLDGAAGWLSHGYGSNFDGESWLMCFCNECLMKMKPIKLFDYLDGIEVEDT